MNKSSSSSSSSPPFTTLPPPTSTASNQTLNPSVIPLEYNYRIMSPSSLSQFSHNNANNAAFSIRPQTDISQLDDGLNSNIQYSSLFGDPVPPPPPSDFLVSEFDSRASQLFHGSSVEFNGSSEEETIFGRKFSLKNSGRLFSNVPYTSLHKGRPPNASMELNFNVLPSSLPRLQPPDIQILPNSSGGSSSGEAQDSQNYALLAPNDIFRRQSLYGTGEPIDVSELSETVTISDANGIREYSEATRRMSNISSDFKANVGSFETSPGRDDPQSTHLLGRQSSNESYSSSEWFRPAMHDFPEFSKMPKLRPSSKNVMSIKRDEMPTQHSPVAAMINDSNGSSSGVEEERLLNTTQTLKEPTVPLDVLAPLRPPKPSSTLLLDLETSSKGGSATRRRSSVGSTGTIFSPSPPEPQPPPESNKDFGAPNEPDTPRSIKREMSPVILKESVATGGDYRVENFRSHKKTSFTIISDRSPQSSRAQTPTSHIQSSLRPLSNSTSQTATLTPTPTILGTPKPTAKPRQHLQRKSLTSNELRTSYLMPQPPPSDDSPRPSVQFNMSGRYSPSKMPQKGILQHRESMSSSQDTPLPPPVPLRRPSMLPGVSSTSSLAPMSHLDRRKMRSYETLPLITDPYRTAIPRLHRSSLDVRPESVVFPPGALPRPLRPNPNPTRKQRGLLRVINSAESLSRIPLRSNWTVSADDLSLTQRRRSSLSTMDLQSRRRSSSTSPERRSSTQTASDRRSSNLSSVTTSDFSFRRPSLTSIQPLRDRRKSIFMGIRSTPKTPKRRESTTGKINQKRKTRTKVAKPTTLSPIIGTPNKDSSSPHSPTRGASLATLLNVSETLSDSASRRESISKIPIRNDANSRSNSRLSSLPGSRAQSRSTSPSKEYAAQSRATSSRSPSRTTVRSESRPVSRSDSVATISRSTSRASTRPVSRGPPSRGSSRPNSRIDQPRTTVDSRSSSRTGQPREVSNSRSNSRVSIHSLANRSTSVTPSSGRKPIKASSGRRKSVSLSPTAMRRGTTGQSSTSSVEKKRDGVQGKHQERRRSRSRIPTRAKSDLGTSRSTRSSSKSPNKKENLRRTSSARKTTSSQSRKQPTSAKKAPTSVRKPESSVKRTTSAVSRPPTNAAKKQTSNIQKTAKNLKRDSPATALKKPGKEANNLTSSNVKTSSKPPAGKQGNSASKKKASPEPKELKKQSSSKQLQKAGDTKSVSSPKPGSAGSLAAKGKAGEGVQAVGESAAITAAATATGALMGGLKRQPSTMSLIRMGSRLSLLSRKRPDSSLSRHITEENEEQGELSDQSGEQTGGKNQLHKVNSAGQLTGSDGLPATILEKSQKTLENIQKTVTVATDEIQRKINENLTDLKSLEQDMGRLSDGAVSPTASITTVVENRAVKTGESTTSNDKSPQPPTQPIEASVSVLNTTSGSVKGDGTIATERNFELGIEDKQPDIGGGTNGFEASTLTDEPSSSSGVDGIGKHRQSPDGQGGSTAGSDHGGSGSRELLEASNEDSPRGCCRCCARFCMPCRRSRCSRCCRRNKKSDHDPDESEDRPVLSATSSTTTTNLEVIDETTTIKKDGCWKKLNCFKKKSKTNPEVISEEVSRASEPMRGVTPPINMGPTTPSKQGKCGACLRKIFCCRSTNKVEATSSDDEEQSQKKCTCFPCCRKKHKDMETGSRAWQDPEQGIAATEAGGGSTSAATTIQTPEDGCCKRFWRKICCCCRKKPAPVPSGSRRASIKAPPPEDTRRKLHNDLVEYTSKMKGAIPVLPLYLAWFCAICNTVFPGLGTLFSGIFCICVGIPRFSQYDSAKARLGSFIINTIVAAAQLFCVLFCFVGWGWSIWWGTIMLKCARKLSKIRKVERLEMEEEQRQAAAAAAAAKAEVLQGATETAKV